MADTKLAAQTSAVARQTAERSAARSPSSSVSTLPNHLQVLAHAARSGSNVPPAVQPETEPPLWLIKKWTAEIREGIGWRKHTKDPVGVRFLKENYALLGIGDDPEFKAWLKGNRPPLAAFPSGGGAGATLAARLAAREVSPDEVYEIVQKKQDPDFVLEMMQSGQMSDWVLANLSETDPGRRLIDLLYDNLAEGAKALKRHGPLLVPLAGQYVPGATGGTEEFAEAQRLMRVRGGETGAGAEASQGKSKLAVQGSEQSPLQVKIMIFPFSPMRLTSFIPYVDLRARRVEGGKVAVSMNTQLPNAFPEEYKTLPSDISRREVLIDENELVIIRRYDQDQTDYLVRAIALTHLELEDTLGTAQKSVTVWHYGLATGLGGGSAGAKGLAGALGAVDTLVNATGIAIEIVNEHRYELRDLMGEEWLADVDKLNGYLATYGHLQTGLSLLGTVGGLRRSLRERSEFRKLMMEPGSTKRDWLIRLDESLANLERQLKIVESSTREPSPEPPPPSTPKKPPSPKPVLRMEPLELVGQVEKPRAAVRPEERRQQPQAPEGISEERAAMRRVAEEAPSQPREETREPPASGKVDPTEFEAMSRAAERGSLSESRGEPEPRAQTAQATGKSPEMATVSEEAKAPSGEETPSASRSKAEETPRTQAPAAEPDVEKPAKAEEPQVEALTPEQIAALRAEIEANRVRIADMENENGRDESKSREARLKIAEKQREQETARQKGLHIDDTEIGHLKAEAEKREASAARRKETQKQLRDRNVELGELLPPETSRWGETLDDIERRWLERKPAESLEDWRARLARHEDALAREAYRSGHPELIDRYQERVEHLEQLSGTLEKRRAELKDAADVARQAQAEFDAANKANLEARAAEKANLATRQEAERAQESMLRAEQKRENAARAEVEARNKVREIEFGFDKAGREAERFAAQWLDKQGYTNIRALQNASGQGIDLVAEKDGKVFFFEVKSSVGTDPDPLSPQQMNINSFVRSRLQRAYERGAGWSDMTQAESAYAGELLRRIKNENMPIEGRVIEVIHVNTPRIQLLRSEPRHW